MRGMWLAECLARRQTDPLVKVISVVICFILI